MKKKLPLHIAVTLAFVFVTVFSPLGIMDLGHHLDIDGGVGNCFFMIGEIVLCQMNVLDHIVAWQAMFATLPPELTTLIAFLLAVLLAWKTLRHLFDPPDISQKKLGFSCSRKSYNPSIYSLLLGSIISPRAP